MKRIMLLTAAFFLLTSPVSAAEQARHPLIPPSPAAVAAAGTMAQPPNILTVPLLGISGKPLPDDTEAEEKKNDKHDIDCFKAEPSKTDPQKIVNAPAFCPPLTLRVLAVGALTSNYCQNPQQPCPVGFELEKNLSPGQQMARKLLAEQIYQHPESVQLTVDEKSLLKRLIPVRYPIPIIVGDVLALLDPTAKPEAIKP